MTAGALRRPPRTLIAFYFDSAKRLTSEERLFATREAGSHLHRIRTRTLASLIEEDWIVRDAFLTIDLAPFLYHDFRAPVGPFRARIRPA
jgi:hypothetical protein